MVHGGETEHNEIPARGASTALTAEAPVAVPVPAHDTGRRGVARDLASAAAARLSRSRGHIAVAVLYLAGAVAVLSRQWRDPAHTYLIGSGQDQHMWEWFFAETARAVSGPHNPLGTNLQNFPDGVNMMANTASFGVGIPLTPVTLLFGPPVTFVLVLTLGLAGTGFAWYWLFARELVTSRSAAALGGLCCGFAPAMVSHGCAHPNFVLLAILPMLLLRMIRLARRAAAGLPVPRVREAVWLALLVSLQIALGEEPLLIFAVGFAVFAIGYYASEPATGRRILRTLLPTLGLGALITLVVCAIPLWWQFFGPQSYQAIDHGPVGNDLDSLIQFPTESLGGKLAPGKPVAMNPTEENAYFGWPLLVLTTATTIWLWRARHREHRVVRACATTALVCGVLSLGISLRIGRTDTGFILPWAALSHVPLLDTVLETRFILAAVPAIAAILALATERIIRYARISTTDIRPAVWFAALALALIPLVPTALPV
ncbi:MAG: glycosyl transferase, partial [Nocardia sp.]|nr:glycosyl transferase [Nocardia sp.]